MQQSNDSRLQHAFNEKGEALSPLLPEHVKNFLIDIDGTVCDDIPNEEPERMISVMPFPDALKIINKWFEEGHSIYFFTSRTEEHRAVTEAWLNKNGFKYHGIIFGKPRGGNYHWIDDRSVKATRFSGKFSNMVKERREVDVFKK